MLRKILIVSVAVFAGLFLYFFIDRMTWSPAKAQKSAELEMGRELCRKGIATLDACSVVIPQLERELSRMK